VEAAADGAAVAAARPSHSIGPARELEVGRAISILCGETVDRDRLKLQVFYLRASAAKIPGWSNFTASIALASVGKWQKTIQFSRRWTQMHADKNKSEERVGTLPTAGMT
jgi:hypothetical protein